MPAAAVIPNPYLVADLIGFSTGLVITLLLLALTLRAAKLPGTPLANILLACCALTWNLGGLAHAIALSAGVPKKEGAAFVALVIQFTSVALWPIPLLTIWRRHAVTPSERRTAHVLLGVALLSSIGIVGTLWARLLTGIDLVPIEVPKRLTAISSMALALGALLQMRGAMVSSALWFSSCTIFLGLVGATLGLAAHMVFGFASHGATGDIGIRGEPNAASVLAQQSTLLIVLGSFFLFARFRFADVFIRQSLRIVVAALLGGLLAWTIEADLVPRLAAAAGLPQADRLFFHSVLTAGALLAFVALDRALVLFVTRRIVRAPDYRLEARHLADTLRGLHDEDAIIAAARDAACRTLELHAVDLIPLHHLPAHLWPAEIHDDEIVDLDERAGLQRVLGLPDAELIVPVRTAGRVTAVLAVSPGQARRGLVTHEVDHLRTVATQLGSRLDSLQMEREMVERQHREALLRQQLTEAELRALRAQIDPHFLFNSLNTIADLIVGNPAGAEAMTLRLAKVFRHVLAQSSRPMTSIRDEFDFLQAYLQIEEARFGDRLQVEIAIAPEVASQHIPSLMLQPLVENALKHGLAPKPGRGRLWISARADADQVCLRVEDDGLGPGGAPLRRATPGVGLANIEQRLAVVYADRASVTLEPRERGGTRVTIRLPREPGAVAV